MSGAWSRAEDHVGPASSRVPAPRLAGVDVRIGVTYSPKELDVELGDGADPETIRSDVEKALADESGMLWFTDRKGRQVGVPVAKVAFVEIGSPRDERRIGFAGG